MAVSEITDRLSPNVAPPITAPITSARSSPAASDTPSAIGETAAIVPIDVPTASDRNPATRNNPGRISAGGKAPTPSDTTASTAPICLVTMAKAPASRKIRHIRMMLESPIPASNVSMALTPLRCAIHRPSANAGRIATGACNW